MKEHAKLVKKYCREIRQWLPCSQKLKKRIISEISDNVAHYLSDAPTATYSDIEQRFGTPKQIATTYINEMDTSELLENLRVKRKITTAIISTCLVLIAIWGIAVTIALIDAIIVTHGYGVYS